MKNESNSVLLEKQLLDEYKVGDFFLASPKRTLLGKGVFSIVNSNNEDGCLTDRVMEALENAKKQGHDNPIVVGAIPFDNKRDVQLIVPESIEITDTLKLDANSSVKPAISSTCEIKPIPEPAQYEEAVEKGVNYIKSGEINKIVLSKSLHLTSSTTVDIYQLLHNLAQHNNLGYTFAVDLTKNESSRKKTLVGASPELLMSRTGEYLIANPLAGSRPRGKDPIEDQRLAEELLASLKDLHEHEVVVNAIASALRPFCKELEVPEKPSLLHTETMWHLSTEIKGELLDPTTSSLELALALHPTPAVCGSPTEVAREVIHKIEPFDRGFFTGILGWCDSKGDGEWIITIRCAEVEDKSLRLFAGAGIVAESKPEEELAETTAKLRTMLRAMGLNKELSIDDGK
ncbi:isochorismate synthase DhbC [Clostridium sp. SHJSY1]|uniref:isochorismate synthase DhbC n=1 Tax=Clostridium sp. SHJSY1 TaxID=2942483 RepID=UPI0028756054|nr:isochorismate synthase DhbC [Clostridium sp. SHJSY1]MDS0528057.1 isochorismate synthase DhbC [Clostridium sp. SHJSY1]